MTDVSFPGPSLMPWPDRVRRGFPYLLAGLAGAAVAVPTGTALALRSIARARGPRTAGVVVSGGAVAITTATLAGRIYRRRTVRSLRDKARVIDPGFAQTPTDHTVSTGPGSSIGPEQVGREGARYLGSAVTSADIEFVTGHDATNAPIRVFVGLDAAVTIDERVNLAMSELRRTGAFTRSLLVVQAPAGTGYANSTPVDVVELLTRGDCASVVVGYGLLPSFLSLDRVDIARRTQAALLAAIAAECASVDDPPRVVLYGESLGAKVQQAALPNGVRDLDRLGISRALWVGTPGGKDYDDTHRLFADVSVTIDRPEQLSWDIGPSVRVWFLEHDGDPVVRFRADLAHRRPSWLEANGERGRGIPDDMTWWPAVTWMHVLIDTIYATDVTPGDFQSSGHDYRADLGAVTSAAYGLDQVEASDGWQFRLEERLRDLEVRRADRLAPGPATG